MSNSKQESQDQPINFIPLFSTFEYIPKICLEYINLLRKNKYVTTDFKTLGEGVLKLREQYKNKKLKHKEAPNPKRLHEIIFLEQIQKNLKKGGISDVNASHAYEILLAVCIYRSERFEKSYKTPKKWTLGVVKASNSSDLSALLETLLGISDKNQLDPYTCYVALSSLKEFLFTGEEYKNYEEVTDSEGGKEAFIKKLKYLIENKKNKIPEDLLKLHTAVEFLLIVFLEFKHQLTLIKKGSKEIGLFFMEALKEKSTNIALTQKLCEKGILLRTEQGVNILSSSGLCTLVVEKVMNYASKRKEQLTIDNPEDLGDECYQIIDRFLGFTFMGVVKCAFLDININLNNIFPGITNNFLELGEQHYKDYIALLDKKDPHCNLFKGFFPVNDEIYEEIYEFTTMK